ncbi:hypothetical protein PoB_003872000 [Plakobranchus ocellatus]|uniref:Uncharacterized protein n=1 Tax=Plakobranchus ocellatus TaxID=259542 RepID=A0AAV4AY64_9GAST|nr:hypothetical protein PoB_003872000 [Plakobranchus ocellatus]
MEALRQAFVKESLEVPEAMLELMMDENGVGATGRRKIYGRLYNVWRAATGGKGRVVWPLEVRKAVREVVASEEGEIAEKYDSQHDQNPQCRHLTLAELASVDWCKRPPPTAQKRPNFSSPGRDLKKKK